MSAANRPSVLLDTNIVLDVLLERLPFLADSQAVWKKCDDGQIEGWVSAVTLTTIFYVGRRVIGTAKALEGVRLCLDSFQVVPVDHDVIETALKTAAPDFEDNVQVACAQRMQLSRIITRDPRGFSGSSVVAMSPADFLAELPAQP